MLMIFFRALLLYVVVVLFIRMMGKRQIGQLQPFELVITLLVADLVATPMQDIGLPIIEGVIPMFALFAIHNVISYVSLKYAPLRALFCGRPSVLIDHGIINEKEMKKLSISLSELLEGLRVNGVSDVSDVHRAMLETNGSLSVILNKDAQPVIARDTGAHVGPNTLQMTVIIDGKVDHRNMNVLHIKKEDLALALHGMGVYEFKEVFVALADAQGTLWVQNHSADSMKKGKVTVSP